MKKAMLALAVLLSGSASSSGQTSVEQLPQGEQVSGWAVEAIPVPDPGPSRSRYVPGSVQQYAGQSGIARYSIGPEGFSSSQFNAAATGLQLAFNGRAFLRVRAAQRYSFAIVAVAHARTAYSDCEFAMQVGGKWIANDRYVIANQSSRVVPSILNAAVELVPGIYPVEFVTGCPGANDIREVEIAFTVRDERDAKPRNFVNEELFHVIRR